MRVHNTKLHLGLAGLLAAGAAACTADADFTGSDSQAISPNQRYLIGFSGDHQLASTGLAAARTHGEILVDLGPQNAVAAKVPEHALEALRNAPGIDYVEVDQPRYPLAQSTPYGIPMVQADQVADDGAGDITVCVIDSGYDHGHEDLPSGSNVTKTDDSGTGDAFTDGCGHGTHVTGTIAALNNDVGVLGVLPNDLINIHVIKYFGDDCGAAYSSSLIAAANECVNAGADVINMSLGGSFKNRTEERAFNDLFNSGAVLPVAAAGNDGSNRESYPASYDGVISVAAIDENKAKADFSQSNSQVELAGPGVAVDSTVPRGTAVIANLTVGGAGVAANGMDGSPQAEGTGALVDCGLGTSTCQNAAGAVCLIERGEISFADKVLACQDGGGVAAVIYNNEPGALFGTLGDVSTEIPSAGIAQADGQDLVANSLGTSTTLAIEPGDYDLLSGTSMATPHVTGVAALVWSHHPTLGPADIRDALAATAEDLGASGRDNDFGFGLVQAKAALDYLGGGGGGECTVDTDCDAQCADGEIGVCTDGQCSCEPEGGGDQCTVDSDCDAGCAEGEVGVCTDGQCSCEPEDGGQCLPKHEACDVDADCCSLKCRGPSHNRSCK